MFSFLASYICMFLLQVTGDSIYNLLRIGEVETDKDDRPMDPAPKITSIEVWFCSWMPDYLPDYLPAISFYLHVLFPLLQNLVVGHLNILYQLRGLNYDISICIQFLRLCELVAPHIFHMCDHTPRTLFLLSVVLLFLFVLRLCLRIFAETNSKCMISQCTFFLIKKKTPSNLLFFSAGKGVIDQMKDFCNAGKMAYMITTLEFCF